MGRKKAKQKAASTKRSATPSRESTSPWSSSPTRREQRFTSIVPVRFEPAMLDEVRERAATDGRSVSAWIRRVVEIELQRGAGDRSSTRASG